MSNPDVRLVPVTRQRFERACARDGAAPIERLKVSDPGGFLTWPVAFDGILQPGGHYLVPDAWIGEALSGRYVLHFKLWEPAREREPKRPFFSGPLVLEPRPFYGINSA
jgi:hypothetical protein